MIDRPTEIVYNRLGWNNILQTIHKGPFDLSSTPKLRWYVTLLSQSKYQSPEYDRTLTLGKHSRRSTDPATSSATPE
jgi:hypothetical protein